MNRVFFLGPQRFRPTLVATLDRIGVEGTVAAITAGWQEREQEVGELQDHIHRELINLRLYERAEEVFAEDAELRDAVHERQQWLREEQSLYRRRLAHTLNAAREVMTLDGRDRFVREHRQAAIRAVRTLDRQHLTRVRRIHAEFEERMKPSRRPAVAAQREQLQEVIGAASAVAIAGGHVAVLLNRLRLFGFAQLLADRVVVAWSAGAMALTGRVILFHDRPPQGAGDAEVLDAGLGLVDGIIALPHARRRLDLDDPVRVALMARRFSPDLPALLDVGSEFVYDGSWRPGESARKLSRRGGVVEFKHS
ncbi:MAG: type 1 glutamine amidotransferase-like domain-containing protein [Acidobacteria bacterium]|nr:type 1 glutamine amidotransferase-like domain-containing protein [Acidobacteriota bacterium]NIM62182.1 type 1 glutamine amidotransferase-like domain-containing protein [Acidobacteriota bacterium]NIO58976.1 type 1 glutamine amidotransferase-like domain-containing protein [Acidobacteriota bacterium]NIQ30022.1 type 1 glutamine amidotransferase-like domain-containing protein [Acidobacteriota bacterium]NIQ84788.1 type 1 glutamine amidotransferase-like domain-containing protein [Acidobacteriota ba